MDRREFITSTAALAAGVAAVAAGSAQAQETTSTMAANSTSGSGFKLLYAPHFGLFEQHAGKDPIAQLQFMHDEGFRGLEDNGMMKRPRETQDKIGAELERLGMTMGVFVAYADFGAETFVKNDPEIRKMLVDTMKEAVELAGRVRAKWVTVVPGKYDAKVDWGFQTANVIDNLRACAEVFEPAGVTMVLEPLNKRDHPNLFLTEVGQGYTICRGVNSPACKILDDLYHQQITEGNLIPNLDMAWSEIAYFQVGDNPGRKEPTTGEINYKNIFRHLYRKGFKGVVGMEHGKAVNSKEGARALINAYHEVDSFEA